mmetsp:Transcript_31468/g.73514  ORF Transcript_31468/g.73514 Transcript_31468/m.73514 type:complete len:102 (+) Transcript_31468:1189-1494(+)
MSSLMHRDIDLPEMGVMSISEQETPRSLKISRCAWRSVLTRDDSLLPKLTFTQAWARMPNLKVLTDSAACWTDVEQCRTKAVLLQQPPKQSDSTRVSLELR